jgi:hypothetical protein
VSSDIGEIHENNNTVSVVTLVEKIADVFLTGLRAPRVVGVFGDDPTRQRVRVYGDGNGITQDATVTLSGLTDEALQVLIDPPSVTAEVVPGYPATRFDFGINLECKEAGSFVVQWIAVITADQNADKTNDTLEATSEVRCLVSGAATAVPQ